MQTKYQQKPLIVILGPTASGKSDLAVQTAKKFNGEIISADSRQIYQGMDLGSGKITKKEMRGIPHYLLDVASPKKRFTVAQYKKLALVAIKKIQRKNKIPVVCGGTGFYIQAITDNIAIPEVKPDFKFRARLEKKSASELFSQLKRLDPKRAKTIDPKNPRRLIRALEIIIKTGKPVPALNKIPPNLPLIKYGAGHLKREESPSFKKEGGGGFNTLFLGIQKSQPELARRIKTRLQKRLKHGLLAEIKKLRAQGISWKRLDDFGLEYRWLARYLQRKISYPEMFVRLQKETERYAKRQMTWFRQNKKIRWLPPKNNIQKYANKLVKDFLKK